MRKEIIRIAKPIIEDDLDVLECRYCKRLSSIVPLVEVVVILISLSRSLAATKGSVVVDVGHLIAHLSTVIPITMGTKPLRVYETLMLHHHARSAHRLGSHRNLLTVFFMSWLVGVLSVIWDILGNTAMMLRFVGKFSIKVFLEFRVIHDDFRNSILVLCELVFKKLAVLCINASLKLVGFDATIEAGLDIGEKVGHLADISAILDVDEVVLTFLMAYDALFGISVTFGVAGLTDDAVTIEDKPAGVSKAMVALVAMKLDFFVHFYTNGRIQSLFNDYAHLGSKEYATNIKIRIHFESENCWLFCLIHFDQMCIWSLLRDGFAEYLYLSLECRRNIFRCRYVLSFPFALSNFSRGCFWPFP